ncbi:MAG: hypothetical protein HY842_13045, partial [Bacteroidetes bacterium]|nr:hypothetical protein [Bacteroidota bacterium]
MNARRNTLTLVFAAQIFLANFLSAQCPVTANAGPDLLVCDPGASTTLMGSS